MMVAQRVLTEILQRLRKLKVSCDLGRSHRTAYAQIYYCLGKLLVHGLPRGGSDGTAGRKSKPVLNL